MFKWPELPSSRAPAHEIADFAELTCWKNGSASVNAVIASLGRLDENDYSEGVPVEDEITGYVEHAYREIEQRREACRGGYPFEIDSSGYTLKPVSDNDNPRYDIYCYLLLATRLNMKNSRRHADIDGTLLLEELSAVTAREYLGDRAECMVFGTSSSGVRFVSKVNDLCRRLAEGDGFPIHSAAEPSERDGQIDIAVWKHFADRLPGKLIAFGQCKTGTHYRNELTQLQPDSFCRKWFRSFPAVPPIRMFFVAEALSRIRWYETASDAGLLFDRLRDRGAAGGVEQAVPLAAGEVEVDALGRFPNLSGGSAAQNRLKPGGMAE